MTISNFPQICTSQESNCIHKTTDKPKNYTTIQGGAEIGRTIMRKESEYLQMILLKSKKKNKTKNTHLQDNSNTPCLLLEKKQKE